MNIVRIGLSVRALPLLLVFWSMGAAAETALERGAYLVQGIAACGNCHTPKGPEGDIPGMDLAGMIYKDAEGNVLYQFPNITPDPEFGVGQWTEEELIAAIREGRRPDGSVMTGIMPFELYRHLSDRDVRAIVAYIRSLPAIENEVSRPPLGERVTASTDSGITSVPDVSPDDPLAYGEYLAGPVGHCIECHTPGDHGEVDYANNLGAGGRVFAGPWGQSVSRNLTPTGLSKWTDQEIKVMISRGVRPDGSPMMPPMGYAYYAHISDADLDAIVAYLRSLPPR